MDINNQYIEGEVPLRRNIALGRTYLLLLHMFIVTSQSALCVCALDLKRSPLPGYLLLRPPRVCVRAQYR